MLGFEYVSVPVLIRFYSVFLSPKYTIFRISLLSFNCSGGVRLSPLGLWTVVPVLDGSECGALVES